MRQEGDFIFAIFVEIDIEISRGNLPDAVLQSFQPPVQVSPQTQADIIEHSENDPHGDECQNDHQPQHRLVGDDDIHLHGPKSRIRIRVIKYMHKTGQPHFIFQDIIKARFRAGHKQRGDQLQRGVVNC